MLAALDIKRAQDERVSDAQHAALHYLWDRLQDDLGEMRDARTITRQDIAALVAKRRGKLSVDTIGRMLATLKRGIALAEADGLMGSPLREADWPKLRGHVPKEAQRGKYHDPATIARWLEAMEPEAADVARFAYLTGLRKAELARVEHAWIEPAPPGAPDVVAALLRVRAASAKSRRERVIVLTAEALAILERRKHMSPVFGVATHRRAFATACRRIGYGQRITLRDLRHTAASIGAGASVSGTRDQLGHGQLSTTNRYVTARLAELAAVAGAVTGALKPEHSVKSGVNGGRTPDRTGDHLRVNQEPETLHDASACNVCAAYAAHCAGADVIAWPDRSTESEHSARPLRGQR